MQRGTLFLVVGPSGAGKDTLLLAARQRLDGDPRYFFPQRVISRPAEAGGEDHVPVAADAFEAMQAAGQFLLHWRAHGLCYGIPVSAGAALEEGRNVVANVSRTVLDEARERFQPVRILSVEVRPAVLRARLLERGREGPEDVERRLQRAAAFEIAGSDVAIIRNDASLEEAARRFLAALGL